jgi:hypothetical protein
MAKLDLQNIKLSDIKALFDDLPNRPFMMGAVVSVVGIVALGVLGIYPGVQDNLATMNKTKSNLAQTTRLQKKLTSVRAAINDNDFLTRAAMLDKVLYSQNTFLPMMYALNEAGNVNYITSNMVTRMEFSPGLVATPSAAFNALRQGRSVVSMSSSQKDSEGFTMFVEMRANYYQLVAFLNTMEQYSPFNSIAYAQLTNNPTGVDSGQFEILAQYYPPTLEPKLETEVPALTQEDRTLLNDLLPQFVMPNLSDLNQGAFQNYGKVNPFLDL